MKYRKDKYGNDLSVLGYGCMRFPKKHGKIVMDIAEKLLCHAVEQGINYYDTAYIYPGSEAALGEIFEKNNLRKKVNIATKLPHYLIKNPQGLGLAAAGMCDSRLMGLLNSYLPTYNSQLFQCPQTVAFS